MAGAKRRSVKLLAYRDIPDWQQSNEFLLSGYRSVSGSMVVSLASVLYLSNETVNIYTHLVGALVFAALPFHFWQRAYLTTAASQPADLVVFSVYLGGVAVCFLFSTLYHIFDNHSARCSTFLNHLDYLGIVVLMWGASIPSIYYGFYCDGTLQRVYWGVMSAIALSCAVVTLNPAFRRPTFRVYRALLYTALGLTGVVFVVHGLALYGWAAQSARMALTWMFWMALANLVGAVAFATRIPERWVPYRFDIFGSSHQLLHVAVIVAAVIHYLGLLSAFRHIRDGAVVCS